MDFTVIAWLAVAALTLFASSRFHSRTRSRRPGYLYQRVITVAALGLWLTVAGAIGWDVSRVHGLFQGTKWTGQPIWWQVGVGLVLLGVASWMAHRLPPDATRSSAAR